MTTGTAVGTSVSRGRRAESVGRGEEEEGGREGGKGGDRDLSGIEEKKNNSVE